MAQRAPPRQYRRWALADVADTFCRCVGAAEGQRDKTVSGSRDSILVKGELMFCCVAFAD